MVYRLFKTTWFMRAARKEGISDRALREAVKQVVLGQGDDLGGGVYKKRLNGNRHRAILIAKADRFWVFTYLYAKQDRANIDDDELRAFRALAALYRRKTERDIEVELASGALTEIHDDA
ncbi:type II toxin-antitoxin system RelE/ParE family toxin [Rhizobium sp. AG855]|uniref:type II toxin-antitoxin system RelE/ParE family toxin n=1 Tax=Rhizobium sp. AG855 TaxID=2183898 RepID=UPI000E75B005|nr:type II toxin-antitoxin system RelE/ParE family toxin [Rhizobium sp. AG855]RKE85595.1 hypothetical protein DFO46_2396 [Rhizobium sp. AG855]